MSQTNGEWKKALKKATIRKSSTKYHFRRERVKSFDAREQESEFPDDDSTPHSGLMSSNNISTQICSILNSAYEKSENKNHLDGLRPAQTPIPTHGNVRNKKDSIEEFKLFCKKECLPKNLRDIDLKVLDMNTRTNCLNLSKNIVSYEEIPEEWKKMINLKYDLKKIEKALKCDQSTISTLKKKIGMRRQKRHRYFKGLIDNFKSLSPIKSTLDDGQVFSKWIENSMDKSQKEDTNSSKTPTNCSYHDIASRYLKSRAEDSHPETKSSFSNTRKKKMHIRVGVDSGKYILPHYGLCLEVYLDWILIIYK